jgi:hypothetical protein
MRDNVNTRPFRSPAQLAARWDCSVGWLANQRSAGLGPAFFKIGSNVRYLLSDIEAYEEARRVEPVAA